MTDKDLIDFSPQPDFRRVMKIHAIETVEEYLDGSGGFDQCNTVFYEDPLEEVIERCQRYLGKPNQLSQGFVIFKAVAIVRVPLKPTEVVIFGQELEEGEEA